MRVLVGRRLGLRLRPAARPRTAREAAAGKACAFAKAAPGGHSARARARSSRQSGELPHAGRARSVRGLARRQGRALPARRAGARARGREGHLGVRPRPARAQGASSPPRAPRSSRSSSSAAAGSTRSPRATASPRSAATRARTAARARRPAGSTSSRSASSARRRASASRRPRCCARTPCPRGVTTVVIDAEQMALQVHESVGHPTELDRVYGTEAAYAGTSFLKPGRPRLASLRLGAHEHHRRLDDARRARHLRLRRRGRPGRPRADRRARACCSGFLTSRETAARIGSGSGGSMRADSWSRMPLVRMTNLHLEPGEGSLDELIADVDDGRLPGDEQELVDRRQAAQLPVRDADRLGDQGRQARPDAARRDLHRADAASSGARSTRVAGPDEWRLHGLTNCGKGQPGQHAHVSHGASPARFRNVQVGFKAVSALELAGRRAARGRGRRGAGARAERALRAGALRRLGGAPADADRERRSSSCRSSATAASASRRANRTDDEGLRALAARAAEAADSAPRRPRLPGARAARRAAGGRGLRRGDGRARRRRPGAARGRGDRRRRRSTSTASSRAASPSSRSPRRPGSRSSRR